MKTSTFLTLFSSSFAIIATALEAPQVSILESDGMRLVQSNGLPNHDAGRFPNQGNPHSIAAQNYSYRVTLTPKPLPQPVPTNHATFGVAVNGVPFEAGTAEFWNGDRAWNYEAKSGKIDLGLDQNDAHVQPGGKYHYHATPHGLIAKLGGDDGKKMRLIGWAADGFPIYATHGHSDPKDAASPLVKMRSSYQLKKGQRPRNGPEGDHDGTFTADYEYAAGAGDLDECNGRFGVTPEYPQGIYHYYITETFPYLSRQWRGQPDSSFEKKGPPGGGPGGPGGPPGRRGRRGGPGFGPPPPGFGPPPRGF